MQSSELELRFRFATADSQNPEALLARVLREVREERAFARARVTEYDQYRSCVRSRLRQGP
jgi:hypothetical protein